MKTDRVVLITDAAGSMGALFVARFLAAGEADLVAFGVPLIANPDLVQRPRTDAPFNKPDPSKF